MSRPVGAAPRLIRFSVYEVDTHTGELRKNGAKVRLDGQPYQVLAVLLERPGDVVSREELKRRLWPADTFVDFERGINTAVTRLRQSLGDSADTPRFIETLPRRGYRFVYPTGIPSPQTTGTAARWNTGAGLAILTVGVLLGSLGVLITINPSGLRDRILGASAPSRIQSIAVLPFRNLTGDRELDFYADGLTDVLTTELARVRALRVTSVTSAMSYKGSTSKKLPDIAGELNVDAVIDGSIRRSDEGALVNIQLILAATDRHLWANSYATRFADFASLNGRLARDIIAQTRVQVTETEGARLARSRTLDPQAYTAYLKGLKLWSAKITLEGHQKSVESYQLAIDREPTFAEAYSAMARSYLALHQLQPAAKMDQRAEAAATRALELDPTLADPHTVFGVLKQRKRDMKGAEEEYRTAIDLSPSDSVARLYYAVFLNAVDRHKDALEEIRRAEQLDPLSPYISANVILRLMELHEYNRAVEQGLKALELDPEFWLTHQFLAGAYWEKRLYKEATAAWEMALHLRGGYDHWPLSRLVEAYWIADRRADALTALARLEALSKTGYVEPVVLAHGYGAVGRRHDAVVLLERAWHEGVLPRGPRFRALARFLGDEPRFQDLLRRQGIPASAVGTQPATTSQ